MLKSLLLQIIWERIPHQHDQSLYSYFLVGCKYPHFVESLLYRPASNTLLRQYFNHFGGHRSIEDITRQAHRRGLKAHSHPSHAADRRHAFDSFGVGDVV